MATTLIDLSEEEQALELVSFLVSSSSDAPESEQATALTAQFQAVVGEATKSGDYAPLLARFVQDLQKMFDALSDQDLEAAYCMVCSIMVSNQAIATDPAKLEKIAVSIADSLTADSADRPSLRLKLLTLLYNHLEPKSSTRFVLLLRIIKYAAGTGALKSLLLYVQNIDDLVKDWNLDKKQTLELYLLLHSSLEQAGERHEAYSMLVKYLKLADATSTDQAKQAVKLAVQSEDMFQMDMLLGLAAVKALEKSDPSLYQLLNIFTSGDYTTYSQFYAKNKKVVDAIADNEKCVRKMRLLTLVTLAGEKREVPYSEVVDKLKIEESDAEKWFIDAISVGLLEGKMNQQTKVMYITKCTHRVFEMGDWQKLGSCATEWKQNVSSLLEALQAARPPAQ